MNILLTNDDGIDSQGMRVLAKHLSSCANVWVCVPKEQQSGTGMGITVRESLHVREEHVEGAQKAWSVDGKPVDCVKLAFLALLREPIDLVFSGINEGSNLGTDTLYSGTVAGAMEGALGNKPAVALSLDIEMDLDHKGRFEAAARMGVAIAQKWEAGALKIAPMSILNVNVPDLPPGEIKGIRAARLGIQRYSDIYELLEEKEGLRSYCLKGDRLPSFEDEPMLDIQAIAEGYITVTPLSADRTDFALLREIEGQVIDFMDIYL